ncbi:hypothetical protein ABGV42_01210 [Paenibacillus pabuli]|uniref:hypothetical protein n=1 Tax=Paenibacillus pabuli TaxID=1472 RepID=UPI0032427B8F
MNETLSLLENLPDRYRYQIDKEISIYTETKHRSLAKMREAAGYDYLRVFNIEDSLGKFETLYKIIRKGFDYDIDMEIARKEIFKAVADNLKFLRAHYYHVYFREMPDFDQELEELDDIINYKHTIWRDIAMNYNDFVMQVNSLMHHITDATTRMAGNRDTGYRMNQREFISQRLEEMTQLFETYPEHHAAYVINGGFR